MKSSAVSRRLSTWFTLHARDLPWRRDRDPYRIWISEIMLQQTQVATVIPYFERFLTRFPTLADLAAAEEAEVLRLWEGLGYYRRARAILQTAKTLHAHKHATIPNDLDLVASLPGFGRYTVNAVLSQAYERRLPILEANSQRVLCRLFNIEEEPKQSAVQKRLWELAETLLPKKDVGKYNQAMMELGAMVCVPDKPRCEECPLQPCCQAFQQHRQDAIPKRQTAAKVTTVEEVAIVVRQNDAVLMVQRPDKGRWAKLWECPHHPREWMESHTACAQRLLIALNIDGEITREIATIRHTVTRFDITMVCLEVAYRGGSLRQDAYADSVWVTANSIYQFPLSSPQRQLFTRLGWTETSRAP